MSWFVANRLNLDRTVHTTPIRDAIRHDFGPTCVCGPTVRRYLNGNTQVIHHSLDGRELVES